MKNVLTRVTMQPAAAFAALSLTLIGASANATHANARGPAAIIASGACISKYVTVLDDGAKSAADVGHLVAARCARQISHAAHAAAIMNGQPDQFASNFKYMSEKLTVTSVERARLGSSLRVASL